MFPILLALGYFLERRLCSIPIRWDKGNEADYFVCRCRRRNSGLVVERREAQTLSRALVKIPSPECDCQHPLGYPEGLQCTEVPLMDFEADIFQAAVAQVLQFSTVIMAFPAK
jgi:hypothetical protein